ncbi:hypothetical protein CBER1_10922 [Cercospora berteroae]|uniref:Uncharacterized protein n=1 Tax=Cercospora berteroae TaxID=357750 RepID=A0A2S6C9Q5_9PEZI|nr:hypothetical protein CBER1_10922 [Cercospora berteroae]
MGDCDNGWSLPREADCSDDIRERDGALHVAGKTTEEGGASNGGMQILKACMKRRTTDILKTHGLGQVCFHDPKDDEGSVRGGGSQPRQARAEKQGQDLERPLEWRLRGKSARIRPSLRGILPLWKALESSYPFSAGLFSLLSATNVSTFCYSLGITLTNAEKNSYLDPIRDVPEHENWLKEKIRKGYRVSFVGDDVLTLFNRIDDPEKYWVRNIKPPEPAPIDSSKLLTVDTRIKDECMIATMDLLKKSKPLSDGPTYDCAARSMLMTARSCPPESVCVGILPYRNGILPPVASALAYSPLSCTGCTLSVQGLARIMSMVAVENDNAYKSKLKDGARRPFPTLEACYTKFASMRRASYSCLDARVAFVNCCPILASNTAKRVCAMSFFSEWLASMVKIFDNSYKLVVISMGAVPKTSVNDMLESYPNLRTSLMHYNTADPAQFEHMNVNKVSASEPISPIARENKLLMYDLCALETELNIKATFTWNLYPVTTLKIGMSVNGSRLVKALIGHTPDSLFNSFVDRFKQFNVGQEILNAVKMDSQMIIAMRARAEVGAAADRTIGDDMGSPAPSSRNLTFRKRDDDQPTLENQQTS